MIRVSDFCPWLGTPDTKTFESVVWEQRAHLLCLLLFPQKILLHVKIAMTRLPLFVHFHEQCADESLHRIAIRVNDVIKPIFCRYFDVASMVMLYCAISYSSQ